MNKDFEWVLKCLESCYLYEQMLVVENLFKQFLIKYPKNMIISSTQHMVHNSIVESYECFFKFKFDNKFKEVIYKSGTNGYSAI